MDLVLYGWPWLALALAPLLVLALVFERRPAGAPPLLRDPAFVLPLLWPMYLVHQFEEHGVDVFGRRFAFLGGLCATLGHHELAQCPATPAFIFSVNAVGCQLTFLLPWILRRRAPLVAAFAWGVPLVNGVVHLATMARAGAYNPGALTSALLFVPMGAWMLVTSTRAGVIQRRDVPLIFATGVLVHAVLIGSLVLRERGALPYDALLVVQALNGLVPLAIGALVSRMRTSANGAALAAG
jgi:hypothetical protein